MEAGAQPVETAAAPYPVRFDIEYPERLSRWKIFLKWLLAIQQFIIVYLLQIVGHLMVFVAFVANQFTKRWPAAMFDFMIQIQRGTLNTLSYALTLQRNEYPPFSGDAGEYPLVLEIDYDEDL